LRLLVDTHLLIWAADNKARVPPRARSLMGDENNELHFSVASLWEIAIKRALNRPGFRVDARLLRRALLDNKYQEMTIVSDHVVATDLLPHIHKDPFDRLLVAQSTFEGIPLLTDDATGAKYPGSIYLT